MGTKSKKKNKGAGLRPKSSTGLNKKNYRQKSGGGDRVRFEEGKTIALQFLHSPKEFQEFEMHQFKEGKQWTSVPCVGDECVLCEDDDDDISKTRYQFIACVYNFKEKKVQVLRGGKDLAGKIMLKYEKLKKAGKGKKFVKTVYDITQMPGQFVTYDVDKSDDDPKNPDKLEAIDLDEWLRKQLEDYYGEDGPPSSLDDDDDDDDEDDDDEDDDDEPRSKKKKSSKKKRK